MQCPQCQADNDAGLRFCESCGAKLARVCPTCGQELKRYAKFCGKCGASLGAATTPSAAPPHPPPMVAPAAVTDGERRHLTVLFADLVSGATMTVLRRRFAVLV